MTTSTVQPYADCEDSGNEWLETLPDDWEVKRVKDIVLRIGNGVTPLGGSETYTEEGIPFLRSQNVYDEGLRLDSVSFIEPATHEAMRNSQLKPGDILFNITGASIGRTCIVPEDLTEANINQHIAFLRLKARFNARYVALFLKSHTIKNHIQVEQQGASKEAFTLNQIARILLPLPPLPEQEAITAYLTKKTVEVDQRIDLLSSKAEKYLQLKKSLVKETVTRGLNKSVSTKDSGIAWLGELPEHWVSMRVVDVATNRKRRNSGLKEQNLLSLSYGRIVRRDFDTHFGLLPESFETYQIVDSGDIILRLTDLQNDKKSLRIGLVNERGIITSAYLCLHFKKTIYPLFAYYLLYLYDVSKVFYWSGGGVRQSMKFDDIKVLPFVVPPIEEQVAIADYLIEKTKEIDQIVQTTYACIETLKDLRKALINDVVTGKMKVA